MNLNKIFYTPIKKGQKAQIDEAFKYKCEEKRTKRRPQGGIKKKHGKRKRSWRSRRENPTDS